MTVLFQVEKFGDPNGVLRFSGVSQIHRVVEEPVVGELELVFPVTRDRGSLGDIQVNHCLFTIYFFSVQV